MPEIMHRRRSQLLKLLTIVLAQHP